MALARTSLRGFLTHAKNLLQIPKSSRPPLTFVVGNESADLDSISSAIFYSYIASISPQRCKPARFHIPLLNIPREDISLRPELLAILPKANINTSHLITLDDLGPQATWTVRFPPPDTRWVLVDHNVLQGALGSTYGTHVVGAIDHHDDEGAVPPIAPDGGDEPRVITVAGSCSSLVVAHLRQAWDTWFLYVSWSGASNAQSDGSLVEDGAFATLWDAQVAFLVLAAGLVDTAALKDANKTTDWDRRAVEYLELKIGLSLKHGKEYDREAFYDEVIKAKRDLDGLSVRDVLRKDYKAWEEAGLALGTASVVRPVEFLEGKAEKEGAGRLTDSVKTFGEERKLDVVALITGYEDDMGDFRREVALLALGDAGKKVVARFQEDCGTKLQLDEVKHSSGEGWSYVHWRQGNLAASRKQVAPLLREAMKAIQ